MTGNEYRDLIAAYIVANFVGLDVYTEVSLGKTIIGKDRKVDVFVVRPGDQLALAVECKFQDTQGTTDEKIPYALRDLEAMRVGGCLAYAGGGWSRGILHTLEASPLAAYCLPEPDSQERSPKDPRARPRRRGHFRHVGSHHSAATALWRPVRRRLACRANH